MFEEILKKGKDKWESLAKDILNELRQSYENLWNELVEGLNKKKLELEQETKELEEKKENLNREINSLSGEVIKLTEGVKITQENLEKYEIRKNEILNNILVLEEREKKIEIKEKELLTKEKELQKEEEALRIEIVLFEERQRNLKKIYEKIH